MEQIIKVSDVGNLNLPRELLAPLDLQKDDSLMVFSSREGLVIKKMATKPLKDRFLQLSDSVQAQFREQGVTEQDVAEAVAWSRK